MWTRPYGTTGKDVSVISFGGMRFPKPEDHAASAELVLHAYEKGINYFDTAPVYCGSHSEKIFGRAFKQMPADTFYVSTKSSKADGEALRKDLETSLERMGVPRIHFFHIWCVVTLDGWQERLSGGAVAAALKAKDEGLVEHVVISSHLPGNELADVLAEAPFEGVTLGYCALNFPYREAAVEAAGRDKLGIVTMNPLGGGLIPGNAERFDFLRREEEESVVAAALRFNISNPYITSALVGFSEKSHIDQAVAAVENFRPYSTEKIASIRQHLLDSFDGFCTGCGYCLPCPQGIAIPKMMDAYNFKILSRNNPEQAVINRLKWHWNLTPEHAATCSLCGACEPRCTQRLPIRQRMEEIAKMSDKEE